MLVMVQLEPLVLKALGGRNSFGRVLGEHLAEQVFGLLTVDVPIGGVESQLLLEHVFENFLVGIALEGRVAAQENEQNDSERPHVALSAVVAAQNLGSYVVGRAHDCVHLFYLLSGSEPLG